VKVFVDYAYHHLNKTGEELCGDKVEIFRTDTGVIAILSDGLGSGVKANILATLTTKIAITMLKDGLPIDDVVQTIIQTLPVCHVRQLAYSTFTIVNIDHLGQVYVVEFDNPSFFYFKNGHLQGVKKEERFIEGRKIKESRFQLHYGDAIVLISDGVIHAGVGKRLNFGWAWNEVAYYLERIIDYKISALSITQLLSDTVNDLYLNQPGDDVTVVTLKAEEFQEVTLFAGPPIEKEKDRVVVNQLIHSGGKKVVCGGTAAHIVSRICHKELETSFYSSDPTIPPIAKIKGIDLVTEGVLTIKAAVERLKQLKTNQTSKFLHSDDGASQLAKILSQDCTHLTLLVGKAINPAHQNPDFPKELSIKLHVLQELKRVLEDLGKVVQVQYY
jgi:Stage II sporulation protein E (SpoIIE)